MTIGLAACSSDDTANGGVQEAEKTVDLMPTQTAKVAFTSNSENLSEDAVLSWIKTSTTTLDREAETAICNAMLPEKIDNTGNLTTDRLYYAKEGNTTLTFYPILAHTGGTSDLGFFYYDEDNVRHDQMLWKEMSGYNGSISKTTMYPTKITTSYGAQITIKEGYKFGFYWNGHTRFDYKETTYYSISTLNEVEEGVPTVHAGMFVRDGKTYICMENHTDFDCRDIVLMCGTEIATAPAGETAPVSQPKPVMPGQKEDPADPAVTTNGGSVEVNLAMNAEHEQGDWLESHLSIHVRDTTDVTLFIPVGAQYYCPQDDMMIIQKHDVAYQYNEQTETMSMTVGGNAVTLKVKYAMDGITITTEGVNADVLKYCRDTYHDGIVFEIRNYYNNSLNRTQLQPLLNNSTISFTNAPNTYVCAKGLVDGIEDTLACTVKPEDIANRTEPTAETVSEREKANLYIYTLKK